MEPSPEWTARSGSAAIEKEPRGPKGNHRDFSIHTYGNGHFVYQPNLTDSPPISRTASTIAERAPAAAGLSLVEPGEGYAIFEVRSPYIIVPKVGPLDTLADDCEARWSNWTPAARAGPFRGQRPDVARLTARAGSGPARPDAARRRPLRLPAEAHASRQTGPGRGALAGDHHLGPGRAGGIARPYKGKNLMEYRTGDHYGLKTRVMEIRSEAGKPEETLKYLLSPPTDYDPKRKTGRIRGPVVVKVEPPPGTKIAWFTAEGAFATHQRDGPQDAQHHDVCGGRAQGLPRDLPGRRAHGHLALALQRPSGNSAGPSRPRQSMSATLAIRP